MRQASAIVLLATAALAKDWCAPGDSCWPTVGEINALENALDPGSPRFLYWSGPPAPIPSAIPLYSPSDQPLYGVGKKGLKALYVANETNYKDACFVEHIETRTSCLVATRNNPQESWVASITVFALKPAHVQAAVAFAKEHRMCIAVAGTGHDFLNRHSCPNAMFIRTTLMQDIEWSEDGSTIKVGSGADFNLIMASAATRGKFVASGWAKTVGIAGWSTGGGHGPFANAVGLGVDNIVEAEVVIGDGSLVRAAEDENQDLLWALRGGGGSAFGILVSMTIKAHDIPEGGITKGGITWVDTACNMARLSADLNGALSWILERDHRWSGLSFVTFIKNASVPCGGYWELAMQYAYMGSEAASNSTFYDLYDVDKAPAAGNITNYANWNDQYNDIPIENIIPSTWTARGIPSVLVPREKVASGALHQAIVANGVNCFKDPSDPCARIELYNDISSAEDSPAGVNASVSQAFRDAMFHIVYSASSVGDDFYALGDGAYLSESDYNLDDEVYAQRYWGTNAPKLSLVKQQVDPEGVFWCRHCVQLPA